MRKYVHKSIVKFCCYLLAVAVMCVPLAHGAMMSSIGSNHAHTVDADSVDHGHTKNHVDQAKTEPCHDTPTAVDSSTEATNVKGNDFNCDHDNNLACKALCAGASAAIPAVFDNQIVKKIVNSWQSIKDARSFSLLSIPLFKPPRG